MYNAEDRMDDIAKQVIINAVKYAVKDLYVSIADVTQHLLNSPVVVITPPNKPPIMTIPEDEYNTIRSAYDEYKTIQNAYADSKESGDTITEIKNDKVLKNIRKAKSDDLRKLKSIVKFKFTLKEGEEAEIEVWLDKNATEVKELSGKYRSFLDKLKDEITTSASLFSWGSVPGSDNDKLIKFLKDEFDIDWADDSEIRKSDDSKTIRIFKDENSAEIMIDEDEENAILRISDGRTHDLKVKKENDKLKIETNVFLSNGTNGNEKEFEWKGVPLKEEEFGFLGSILDKVITRTAPFMKNFGLEGKEKLIQTFFLRTLTPSNRREHIILNCPIKPGLII